MQPWFTQENSDYACNLGLRRKTLITQPLPPRKRNGAACSAMKWSHSPRKSRTKKRNFSLPLHYLSGREGLRPGGGGGSSSDAQATWKGGSGRSGTDGGGGWGWKQAARPGNPAPPHPPPRLSHVRSSPFPPAPETVSTHTQTDRQTYGVNEISRQQPKRSTRVHGPTEARSPRCRAVHERHAHDTTTPARMATQQARITLPQHSGHASCMLGRRRLPESPPPPSREGEGRDGDRDDDDGGGDGDGDDRGCAGGGTATASAASAASAAANSPASQSSATKYLRRSTTPPPLPTSGTR